MMKPLHLLGTSAAMAALLIFAAAEAADAQRGGRGGGRAGASAGARPSGGASRQVRSSAGSSIHSASRQTSNVNRTASRSGANVSRSGNRVNTGNINTGDINIDVDHGCCHGGWGDNYHPVARGAAIAATTAVVMGAYYSTLPSGCVTVVRVGVNYHQCGAYWYQPVYSGATVQYVVVPAP